MTTESYARGAARSAVTRLFEALGLDAERRGSADWNPLGELVRPGDRVVVKPNWVAERNGSSGGTDCLVTHTSVVDALLSLLQRAQPGSVVIGDAPIQRCDFAALRTELGIDEMVERHRATGLPVRVVDFRNRITVGGQTRQNEERRQQSIIVDLGDRSLLEPISDRASRFRVTRYDPARMAEAHAPGRHRYCVAREVLEADVVVNVPKLKCHRKAGVTGALKNLVGINGDKDFLPHHRKGGSWIGGDSYEGFGMMRHASEALYDLSNRLEARPQIARMLLVPVDLMKQAAHVFGWDDSVEGAWYGNDTVWRMCLDLHRVLRYGRVDGTVGDDEQRRVFTVTDAVVAGEGEGPLAPTPINAGFLSAGVNASAVDWVNARLMGFRPDRIPLVREAMRSSTPLPLVDFAIDDIRIVGIEGVTEECQVRPLDGRAFVAPRGWRGHIENDRA